MTPVGEANPASESARTDKARRQSDGGPYRLANAPSRNGPAYGTLHPGDFFGPGDDEEKLQIWDQWLTTVVDPLAADGRIQWATMSDIADAFIAWEESCGE